MLGFLKRIHPLYSRDTGSVNELKTENWLRAKTVFCVDLTPSSGN